MKQSNPLSAADVAIYTQQLNAWLEIVALSDHIVSIAEGNDWHNMLNLADDRDRQLEAFFKQSISQSLLPKITVDVENIKAQHSMVMALAANRDDSAMEQEKALVEAKADLNQHAQANPESSQNNGQVIHH